MNDFSQRIANLSAERRALIELQLRKNKRPASHKPTIPQLPRSGDKPSFALSFAQQRLWFLDQLEPGGAAYNIHKAQRLKGPLDVAALTRSFQEIVRRHEVLRTTFSAREAQPLQVIHGAMEISLPLTDLGALREDERECEVQRLSDEEAHRPFDLDHGPLVRVSLVRLGPEEHALLLTLHHIIADGWSLSMLFREFTTLYEAYSTGQPSPLPELPLQYADFAVWQRQWLQGEVLNKQIGYWRERLGDRLPVLELPTDRPRPAVQTFHGARQTRIMPQALRQALNALSQREGSTLFMTLLAAFKVLLLRYSGQQDLLIGTPIAGRTQMEIEGLIGFFVNTLVLRTDLAGNPSFIELLGRVREGALEAYAHQDLPFEKLVEELRPERSLSYTPLFQVMFSFQSASMKTQQFAGLTRSPLRANRTTAKFDLSLSVAEVKEGLRAQLEYNTDLFDAATMTRMLGHFQILLEGIVADPQQHVFELPLLDAAERRQLLVEWNNTATAYPQDQCLQQLFEVQAARAPERIALTFGESQISYRELNRRANQLAHHLRTLGVGPETLVGICVERSADMMIGLLGIEGVQEAKRVRRLPRSRRAGCVVGVCAVAQAETT